jgi:hypothetical protein
MKRAVSIRLAIAVLAFCLPLISNSASAQQEKTKEPATTEQKPVAAYRIEFNVREIEDGKRLNSRNYMMMAEDDLWARIRVGNKVPVQTVGQSYEYHDVGMNIDCRPRERGDSVLLLIQVEFSSVVPKTQAGSTPNPVFRTERTEVQSIVTLGKPTLVASIDDVEANRRFEIEVTATKVK